MDTEHSNSCHVTYRIIYEMMTLYDNLRNDDSSFNQNTFT